MEKNVFGKHGNSVNQCGGGDDAVCRVAMLPIEFCGPQPDLGIGGNNLEPGDWLKDLRPLPDRSQRAEMTAAFLDSKLPKGDRRDQQGRTAIRRCLDGAERKGGKARMAVKPPIEDMGINYHGFRSSSRKTSQSSIGDGVIIPTLRVMVRFQSSMILSKK